MPCSNRVGRGMGACLLSSLMSPNLTARARARAIARATITILWNRTTEGGDNIFTTGCLSKGTIQDRGIEQHIINGMDIPIRCLNIHVDKVRRLLVSTTLDAVGDILGTFDTRI